MNETDRRAEYVRKGNFSSLVIVWIMAVIILLGFTIEYLN